MAVVELSLSDRPQVVAMIHVHCTTAILNHSYTSLLDVHPPRRCEIEEIERIVKDLQAALQIVDEPLVHQVIDRSCFRSVVFFQPMMKNIVERFSQLPFAQRLIERALREVEIYQRHGITSVEIENVGAPYFLGCGQCPWEELLTIHTVTCTIRRAYPNLALGVHVLSCNEIEVLPTALINGCFFVRSEASLFRGIRPEGETDNRSNIARFFYLRNILRSKFVPSASTTPNNLDSSHFPMLWSDVKKKHTVFIDELQNIDTWLHNITFAKLEGVIVTGAETGSNVDETSLQKARAAIDKVKEWNKQQFKGVTPMLPLVTGSGLDFAMYAKYADFMIVGTAFKKGCYWENEVDEEEVKKVMTNLRTFQ